MCFYTKKCKFSKKTIITENVGEKVERKEKRLEDIDDDDDVDDVDGATTIGKRSNKVTERNDVNDAKNLASPNVAT